MLAGFVEPDVGVMLTVLGAFQAMTVLVIVATSSK